MRSLSRVYEHVCVQRAFLREGFPTYVALDRIVCEMFLHVLFQMAVTSESLVTPVANESAKTKRFPFS